MKSFARATLMLTVMSGVGCQVQSTPEKPPAEGDGKPAKSSFEPGSPRADRELAVKGNTAFALELYAHLRGKEGNLFFSPHSISTALAMTYAGARGETAKEMARALHFTLEPDRLHPAMGDLAGVANGNGKPRGYQLHVANALWGQKDHPFLADFEASIKDRYGARLKEVDYATNTERARQTINAWVEKQTHDRIKGLLQPGTLDDRTRLVLTNAIYFKGDWLSRFPKDRTHPEDFHLSKGQKVSVPLMRQQGEFPWMAGDGFQALELPYVGKDLSMIVFLPNAVDGLAEFEKSLTPPRLSQWISQLRQQDQVDVALPKFEVTSSFQLNDALGSLGMRQAFDPEMADFSGMDGKRWLSIGPVIHKAFVSVNEEGTEAAASTAIAMVKGGSALQPVVFRADHPFVYLIRDNRTGGILFLGRVMDPRS